MNRREILSSLAALSFFKWLAPKADEASPTYGWNSLPCDAVDAALDEEPGEGYTIDYGMGEQTIEGIVYGFAVGRAVVGPDGVVTSTSGVLHADAMEGPFEPAKVGGRLKRYVRFGGVECA